MASAQLSHPFAWLRVYRYPTPSKPRIAVLRTVRVSITLGLSSLTESEQLTWLEEDAVSMCVRVDGPLLGTLLPPEQHVHCEVSRAIWEETSKCTIW